MLIKIILATLRRCKYLVKIVLEDLQTILKFLHLELQLGDDVLSLSQLILVPLGIELKNSMKIQISGFELDFKY